VKRFNVGDHAPTIREPLSEEEICRHWPDKSPLVSVVIPTFNQEGFICGAIWRVPSQKTKFPYEVLIRDDGSWDQTKAVIKAMAKSYPKIIKTIFEPRNTWADTKLLAVLERAAE
jgi:cellulose synthase/poly-beta-1,6-N-acetylglucosamine synthase-like glycosyltransferase